MNKLIPCFIVGLLLCAAIATTPARADSITFMFTGKVTYVGREMGGSHTPPGPFSKGQSVNGLYTFDPDTTDTTGNNGSGPIGRYAGALNGLPSNLHVTFYDGAAIIYVASLGSGANKIEVMNPSGAGSIGESYKVEGKFSGNSVTGHDPGSFKLELVNSSSNQFDDARLPLIPPTLAAFAGKTFRLVFAHKEDEAAHTVIVKVKDLTMVPLPPAVILFGAGLVALIGLGARNRWRKTG